MDFDLNKELQFTNKLRRITHLLLHLETLKNFESISFTNNVNQKLVNLYSHQIKRLQRIYNNLLNTKAAAQG